MKRRKLVAGQPVIIVYNVDIGFVQEEAIFLEYRSLPVGSGFHNYPVFRYDNKEITGAKCFWIFPADISNQDDLQRLQYELIQTELVVAQIAQEKGYTIPSKIQDKKIKQMTNEKLQRKAALIKKFGFDPLDDVWIEGELANTTREKRWFRFERENKLIFTDNWDQIVNNFNAKFDENITVSDAKSLSKKRMRYMMGAHHVRFSGTNNKRKWVTEARQFEQMHRERENRMISWTNARSGQFPLVRVKKPVKFFCGPWFNDCVEKIPSIFEDVSCQFIKVGVVLRVVSYDPQDKYIRLDFTPDIRKLIKGEIPLNHPWDKETLDYDIWVKPSEVSTSLEPLEPLE